VPAVPEAPFLSRPDPDLGLIRRVARRDADALEALYDRHTPLLLGLAMRIVRVQADAEDVVQQAWVKVWEIAGDHDPSRGTVAAWLLTVVRSKALDLYRSRAARRRAEGAVEPLVPPSSVDPAVTAADAQALRRVRLALQRLDPHFRQVLESAYFEGLTQTEIAERLETPLGTVKTWTRRGLLKLKELLPQEEGT
jgi:RNA polymerase sigma-70 factor (ECF subfamily)